ncbi:receptor-type tyrosine-protein phosphatase mu-like [Mya arenaria]|uniref:receptor-type tyrosine-protein phosphatase mu-like n=1 Tax=Mya arenaria TaxID=6604 RepID=UPI0022E4F155|nr:receptor-type tyrosine-protein phosphatase mu-like [Mya arenaria]
MIFRVFAFLCLARACMTAIKDGREMDCSPNCVCCKGNLTRCGYQPGKGNNYCFDGCIDGIYGHRCHNPCPENCIACDQNTPATCYSCKDTFYESSSSCLKTCQVGCKGQLCNDSGNCDECAANFEGENCNMCKQGKYGTDCSMDCFYQNCRCSDENGCDSCKTGYYDSGTLCKTPCSQGCRNGGCNDDGSCQCRNDFITGLYCTECINGYFGADCNTLCSGGCRSENCMRSGTCFQCKSGNYGDRCNNTCSVGCSGGTCMRDGTCDCMQNFIGSKCESCLEGKYGNKCDQDCSVGCSSSTCERFDGRCECLPNFSGNKCETCGNGLHGLSCDFNCSDKCIGGICAKSDGTCINDCVSGYSGSTCSTPCDINCATCQRYDKSYCTSCPNDYSGSICSCPPNCQCSTNSDKCIGCYGQWKRADYQCTCNTKYCTDTGCHTCRNNTILVEGDVSACCVCPPNCKGGYCITGPKCLDGCEDGFYGMDCSQKCTDQGVECLQCSQDAGKCFLCKKGFFPTETGNCTSCNVKCKNEQCDSKTGKCIEGCVGKFWGNKCDTQCNSKCGTCLQKSGACESCTDLSVHGSYCNKSCSSSCLESRCEQINGYCSRGCNGDFFGNICEVKCPENCLHSGSETTCDIYGHCTSGCSDGYVGDDCTEQKGAVQALRAGQPIGAIVGSVSSGVVIIIGIIVAIFFFRRRYIRLQTSNKSNRNGNTTYQTSITDDGLNESNEKMSLNEGQTKRESSNRNITSAASKPIPVKQHASSHVVTTSEIEIDLKQDDDINWAIDISSKDDQTYYNELGTSTNKSKIPIGQLDKYVDKKTSEAFSKEFEKLSSGLVKPYLESQKKNNMSKNRYKGIYPYDDSRVKIRGSGDSAYINASFIDGYNKPRQYIATLGPMSQQLGDFTFFWKMIWQQRVEKIVMVTNLIEQGTPKCEQYWPNPGTAMTYGDIKVESRSEDEYAEFTRRTFTVTFGSEERTLHHLHFTCWPDKAIPDNVTAMIEFRQRVLSTPSTLNGPTVVHCSAGVGRTGTYIALDILTKEGEAEKAIDISGCVQQMRQKRPNMVQTLGQYQFLHTAVVYSLTFDCKQIKGGNFNQYMNKHTARVLNKQFELLQHTLETRSNDETEAVERNKQHRSKNRANADIPGNENRPRLYLNLKPGASDYINAVYIHSFRMKKRYLVAQTPLPETVIDFLTLAVQERCSCIVSFEAYMDKQKNIGIYYPAANQEVLKKGTFQVSCSREENKTFYAERTLAIQHKGTRTDRTIPHLQFTDWDEIENKPRSTTNFLSFLNVIENVMKQQDDGPILVHCFDGAGKSGLFCVVSLLLHKMTVEHEVSVLNAVRKVKTTRRLAIPNQEQFVFCLLCVSEYLRSFDVYANFSDDTGQH